jgi:hypothetical protein
MLKQISFFFLWLVTSAATAGQAEKIYDCKPTTVFYKDNELIFKQQLNNGEAGVYLLHNTSKETLTLDHRKKDAGAGAGWASQIAPNHWSAIIISDPQFNMQCTTTTKDGLQVRDCAVLKICQPKNMAIIQAEGNYWTEEDKSLRDLKKNLNDKHID